LKPRILMLFPGPVHFPEQQFRSRLEGLSRYFSGAVVAHGSEVPPPGTDEVLARPTFGSFDLRVLRYARGRLERGRRMLRAVRALDLEARAADRPFDLVVSYDPLQTGLAAVLAARRTGARLVIEVNGDYWAPSHYDEITNSAVRSMKRWVFLTVEAFVLGRADGIKLLYPSQLEPFRRFVRSPVVASFSDYVDVEAFRDLGDSREVLFIGFPFYVKGIDVLTDAYRRVADEFPDWRLKILGWYEGEELERLRQAIGCDPRIVHHPPVPHREIAPHIGRCGLLVLPSRTEGMGRVLLEAMAAGKPRIGTRVGGIPTMIRHGVDGLIVPPEDPAALRELMGNAERRAAMGLAAGRRARDEFSVAAYLRNQRDFYYRVLGRVPPEDDG
jgi:glycosyltransferase involved in cell wall biosynthesis